MYTFKLLDRGIIELLGPSGFPLFLSGLSNRIHKLQTGYIYHYAFLMVIGFSFMYLLISSVGILPNFIDFRLFLILLISFFISI